ncbi:MAG TPA: HD domain-containing protein [Bryobacteraceae bacterium]|nr:HD domain-containing protein [Bryobacteraceae bacterium]
MLSERFEDALVFAHHLHRNQKRKTTGVPYVAHLLGAASLVIDDGGTEDEAIAALLHDAIEDQSRTFPGGRDALAAEIERRYGTEVLRIVIACTEQSTPEERRIPDKRARWRAHKQHYIEQIVTQDVSVRRVSCADSIHNVRSMIKDYARMGNALWSRFLTKSGEDQLWAYDALAHALTDHGGTGLASELRRAVDDLARLLKAERAA